MGVSAYGKEIKMTDIKTTIEETAETVATPETSAITEGEAKEIVGENIPELQKSAELSKPIIEFDYFSTVKIPREEYKELIRHQLMFEQIERAITNHGYGYEDYLTVITGKNYKEEP